MSSEKKSVRGLLLRRGFDIILIGAMLYAALLALGIVRRGGRLAEGKPAPEATLYSPEDGKSFTLADLRGKPVVLFFFGLG
jgi:cytochrome oxidase Cu insertion factor (SCO1/SenC/PrrC family)